MENESTTVEESPSGEGGRENQARWYAFWTRGGDRLQGEPAEWNRALIEVRVEAASIGGSDWTDLRLLRNGSLLPLRREEVGRRVRTVAPWPQSGPGHYDLRLKGPEGNRKARVSIWPKKITRGEYERLLEDLESKLPTQVAVALQNAGGLAGIELTRQEGSTLAQELLRLRRAIEGTGEHAGLAAVLRELGGQPHRVLTSEERWVRSGRARRPTGHRLGQAYARPDNVEDGALKEVPDARTRHTADIYENRLLRQFERQVRFRLRRVETLLQERDSKSSAEASTEASRLLKTLQGARRKAPFLEDVSALKRPPSRASQVLQKRPMYRAALKGYLEFQREIGISLDAPEIEVPLDNLPSLYQLWCTLQLVQAALSEAEAQGFEIQRSSLFHRKEGFLTLSLGRKAARMHHPESGMEISIYTEHTYSQNGSKNQSENGALGSVGYSQRPDVAIEITRPTGGTSILLFDPKYKLDVDRSGRETGSGNAPSEEKTPGRPKKPDIDKMHAYRDAIRDKSGTRVVEYAAILYPGPTETFSEGLEAISAQPGSFELSCNTIANRIRKHLK